MKLECTLKLSTQDSDNPPRTTRMEEALVSLEVKRHWDANKKAFEDPPSYVLELMGNGTNHRIVLRIIEGCITSMTDAEDDQVEQGKATTEFSGFREDLGDTPPRPLRVTMHISEADKWELRPLLNHLREISSTGRCSLENDKRVLITTQEGYKDMVDNDIIDDEAKNVELVEDWMEFKRLPTLTDNITVLCIHFLNMTQIDRRLFELHQLVELALGLNRLGDDEDDLNHVLTIHMRSCWPVLKKLVLNNNGICRLEGTSWDALANHVTYLDLSFNNLKSLNVQKLSQNFDELLLDGNDLRSLPTAILAHDHFSELDIGRNEFIVLSARLRARTLNGSIDFTYKSDSVKVFAKLLCTDDAWSGTLNWKRKFTLTHELDSNEEDSDDQEVTLEQMKEQLDLPDHDIIMLTRARTSTDMEFEEPEDARLHEWDRDNLVNIPPPGRLPSIGTRRRRPPTLLAMAYERVMQSPTTLQTLDEIKDASVKKRWEDVMRQVRGKLGNVMQVCTSCNKLCSAFESRLLVDMTCLKGQYDSCPPAVWHVVLCARCHVDHRAQNPNPVPIEFNRPSDP